MWDQWWSIEVLDGPFSAEVWFDAHGSALVEAAITNRAVDWFVHRRRWGLVFEVRFGDDDAWLRFRGLPGVRAALDAVPDPVNGLLIYRGRGGGAGAGVPRRPRPTLGAGAASLPEPVEPFLAAGDGPPDDDLNDALEEAVPGPRPLGPAVTPAGKPRDPG